MFKSIITAVLITLAAVSGATASDRLEDLTISQLTEVEEIKSTIEYLKTELATLVIRGEITEAVFHGGGVVNVRISQVDLVYPQYDWAGNAKFITHSGDLIVQLRDIGTQYVVTGYWGAAENH